MSSNPTPLTLQSLQPYVDAQEEIIESLLRKGRQDHYFRDPNDEDWAQFWDSAWGKPVILEKEKVVRGTNPVDNSLILPNVVPPTCRVLPKPKALDAFWGDFDCKKFLIRDEYQEAHHSILATFAKERAYSVFIVTGQPGIGKSIFLLLLLLQRLALKLPTILQIENEDPVLFYKNGVKQFGQPNSGAAYAAFLSRDHPFRRIWALVDTNQYLPEPSPAISTGPFFVIEVTSRHQPHLGWVKNLRRETFYMKLWSFSEVLQVRHLISTPPSEKELWHLYITYGASLRSLFLYADRPGTYDEKVVSEICSLSPNVLRGLLLSTREATNSSYYLVTTGPLPNDRTKPETKIASPYVFAEFCRLILMDRVEVMEDYYNALRLAPTAAGMIFKYRAHRFLREGRTLDLLPILAPPQPQGRTRSKYIYDKYTNDITRRQRVVFPRLEEYLVDKETQHTHEPNVYYYPRSTNLLAVDSWVLVRPNPQGPPIVLAFHMTIDTKEYDAEKSSLDRLGELVPGDAQVYHVILTPEVVKPQITVPTDYLMAGDEAFRVFHCKIETVELFKPHPI